jgi:zinc protease
LLCAARHSCAPTAQQAKPWEQIPIPKLHDFKPQQPKRIELKNGIVIFLQEDHELPFVSGSVLIPGGSRDEDPAKAGLVDLYGQAWRTSGTAKMDGDALDDLLEAKAAHIETGGRRRFHRALLGFAQGRCRPGLFAGHGPALSPQIQRGKAATGAAAGGHGHRAPQRRRRRRSPSRESAKLVYGANSPYTRQPELATIGAVTLDDLKAWHDRTLIGGKLIVGISGDFDPAAMEAKLRAAFEGLPPVKPAPPATTSLPTQARPLLHRQGRREPVEREIVGLGTTATIPTCPPSR